MVNKVLPSIKFKYAGAYVQGNSINNYKMIHTTGGTAAIATTKQDVEIWTWRDRTASHGAAY